MLIAYCATYNVRLCCRAQSDFDLASRGSASHPAGPGLIFDRLRGTNYLERYMPLLRTVTFSYKSREDRVLAAVNIGQPDAWSCWITRRLALAIIEGSAKFLASTSPLAKRAASTHQRELAEFERESAMASTAKGMSVPSSGALEASTAAAELAERLTITQQGERFRVELWGDRAGNAIGMVTRPELQRIIGMLQVEGEKAKWTSSAEPIVQAAAPKAVHH
jgi:hypothetical protein